ncbi:Collagen alpha-1(XVI) chain [Acipenser ruthenus]|uniref:Collagen alpha-1(XVI) chain n=1 Tax=Acipenser ruthenus TaxID=7906 RepID=A0A444V5D9_ACIRT|nr:Collagen alpha-1(XVI) chain [Acipenser ruthenus]
MLARGFNIVRRFSLLKTPEIKKIRNPGGPLILRLGRLPLIKPTAQVFPHGLPAEFTLVTTLLLKKKTVKENLYVFQISDAQGYPQISLGINGPERSLELRARGAHEEYVGCVFSGDGVASLFDLKWHKIALSVQKGVAAVHVDCSSIETKPLGERQGVEPEGHTLIGLRAEDGTPVEVFPHGLPAEFTLVTTLLLKKKTVKENLYVFQISDAQGYPQVRTDNWTLPGDGVASLFDLKWHKIALSVQKGVAAVHVDCSSIETKPLGERQGVEPEGHTLIGLRAEDGTPVEFDIQQITIYCDPALAIQEACCEIPGARCPPDVSKSRREAEVSPKSNLIEIAPQQEGKVYTRCFCLEESEIRSQGTFQGIA